MKKVLILLTLLGFLFSCLIADEDIVPSFSNLYEYNVEVKQYPIYSYPIHNLRDTLEKEGKTSLKLFSYGSLMSCESARMTLSREAVASSRPALGFGIKRSFDYDAPINPNSKWGRPNNPLSRGMLNVVPSNAEDFVNGVIIDIPLDEIEPLLKRETRYDLIPIVTIDWDGFIQGKTPHYEIVYTLSSSNVNPNLFPRPGYYELARDAAEEYGPVFGLLWMETTYLADGVHDVTLWEKWIKEQKPVTSTSSS